MLSPADVDRLLAAALPLWPAEDCPLGQARGRVLRTSVAADRDFPPYDRATMDGYALSSSALQAGAARLRIAGLQAAGMLRHRLSEPTAECWEIATGAVVPEGCDLVVPYEETEREGAWVNLRPVVLRPGAFIHAQGSDAPVGRVLLGPGKMLGPAEIAVAASCGAASLRVTVQPRIALVSTGDELVDVENQAPAPHQVRRSNDYALKAELEGLGFTQIERLHLRDMKYELETQLGRLIAEFDVIVLTGGVSKGKLDLVPIVLEQLRVDRRVQGVSQRPGKPFWFGLTPRQTPVFALPGNPVSTTICFHRYVVPSLRQMRGENPPAPASLPLAREVTFAAPLTPLLPVTLVTGADGHLAAEVVPNRNSGDFLSLLGTDGFIELPPGPGPYPAGTYGIYRPWSGFLLSR